MKINHARIPERMAKISGNLVACAQLCNASSSQIKEENFTSSILYEMVVLKKKISRRILYVQMFFFFVLDEKRNTPR